MAKGSGAADSAKREQEGRPKKAFLPETRLETRPLYGPGQERGLSGTASHSPIANVRQPANSSNSTVFSMKAS
jgi:hypothetical protein